MGVIAITGAGRGIGLELVRQYAGHGDEVLALCREPGNAADLAQVAAASDGRVTIHRVDVADDVSVEAAAAVGTIDVLLNVAGIVVPETPIDRGQDWTAWRQAFEVMTIGPVRVLQAFLPRLGSGAKAISLTSQLAASTWPYGGLYAYGAAKAGLNRAMRSIAIDLQPRGIVVGVVHPGWVQTDMGGAEAEITPQASAAGIRQVVADWPLERSGDFLKWNGDTHPW